VTNNGTIEGTIAIKFEENFSADFNHWVVNNGLLIGHVQFENGADEYDGSRGEIRGTVFGYGGADRFLGGKFGDSFDGGADSDTLDGGGGTDWLSGGDGNDTIIGGAGIDRLSGGLGSDLFVYKSIADSRSYLLLEDGTKEMPDIIRDFQSGLDKIDLSAIDAIAGTSADDSFTFIGSAAFSNRAGELRVVIEYGAANIYADVDGDGVADMQISLLGNTPIATDFIL
jgi:serralysin